MKLIMKLHARVKKLEKEIAELKEIIKGIKKDTAEENSQENERKNAEIFFEPIEYSEALIKIGGTEEIERYKNRSEALQKQYINTSLDEEIQKILPPHADWKSFSTKLIHQPYVENLDELYDMAQAREESFAEEVRVLGKEASASQVDVAPPKCRNRAINKAMFKYKDHEGDGVGYYRITDILRATIAFPDLEKMYAGVEIVLHSLKTRVKEYNDRFQNPKKCGYRDIQIVFELDGFMCELQFSIDIFLQAKATTGHRNYEVYRELMAAVDAGDIELVQAALDFGQDALGSSKKNDFMRDDEHICLLPHMAAKTGEAEILDALLKSNADPNKQDKEGDTPLHHAVYNGHERCVWLLLSKYKCRTDIKNNKGETALLKGYFMLYGEQPEPLRRSMVTLLQSTDNDQVQKTIEDKDKILRDRVTNNRLLVDYAADGNTQKMEELLKVFGDPDSSRDGETALQAAVRGGHIEAVKLLLKFNASTKTGKNDKLIVQEAVDNGDCKIAHLLISKGASCKDTTWESLVKYAEEGDIKNMEKVLKLGVSPNSRRNKVSALRAALRASKHEAVKLLLQYKASTEDCKGLKPIVQEAIDLGDIEMKDLLIENGACCRRILPVHEIIKCQVQTPNACNWNGNASYHNKVFFTPHDATSVLVVDGDTKEVRYIPCGSGTAKWSGMVRYGSKLFCAPFSADSILVIDGETEELRKIPCNVKGIEKWFGIARCGRKLFCAPYNAPTILMMDAETEEVKEIECNVQEGMEKWCGIAQYDKYLFCAPYQASSVLVIDGESEEIHGTISCDGISGERGIKQWAGIARYERKLYCAPNNASSVLVIDGETQTLSTIRFDYKGYDKWRGIERVGDMLFCAPSHASNVLIIDGETDEIMFRSYLDKNPRQSKWNGIAQCGTELYCSPSFYKGILVLKDQALQHSLRQVIPQRMLRRNSSFLLDFARDGNIKKMKQLLDADVSPNSLKDGSTPLQVAILEGNEEAVKLLLERSASMQDIPVPCIVTYALNHGHKKIAKILCEHGASFSRLVEYAKVGNVEEMKNLFDSLNVNPNSYSDDGVSALQAAVRGGHKGAVELLLNYKVSTADSKDGIPILQEALDFDRNIDIAQLLFDNRASHENLVPSPRTIPLDKQDHYSKSWKWSGIARYKNKLFCAPHFAQSILVIDGDTEEVHTIKISYGKVGVKHWHGIACYGNKIFCAPYNATDVLVINGDSEEVHFIPCDVKEGGNRFWNGIAVCGNKLFCAPYSSSFVLVIDGDTEKIKKIHCGGEGEWKWCGIARCGTKLFCAPYMASSILVIDGKTEKLRRIPFERTTGEGNYVDITCYRDKILYCTPWWDESVLMIDGETEEIERIPTYITGGCKWHGAVEFGDKIVFSPCQAASILIVDAKTNSITTQKCMVDDTTEEQKWGHITRYEERLFCVPFNANNILVLEDRCHQIQGFSDQTQSLRRDEERQLLKNDVIESRRKSRWRILRHVNRAASIQSLNFDRSFSEDIDFSGSMGFSGSMSFSELTEDINNPEKPHSSLDRSKTIN